MNRAPTTPLKRWTVKKSIPFEFGSLKVTILSIQRRTRPLLIENDRKFKKHFSICFRSTKLHLFSLFFISDALAFFPVVSKFVLIVHLALFLFLDRRWTFFLCIRQWLSIKNFKSQICCFVSNKSDDFVPSILYLMIVYETLFTLVLRTLITFAEIVKSEIIRLHYLLLDKTIIDTCLYMQSACFYFFFFIQKIHFCLLKLNCTVRILFLTPVREWMQYYDLPNDVNSCDYSFLQSVILHPFRKSHTALFYRAWISDDWNKFGVIKLMWMITFEHPISSFSMKQKYVQQ